MQSLGENQDSARCFIDLVPDEILSEIQSLATHLNSKDEERFLYPSVLCKVCRRWREVANSSPIIWSFIFIDNIPSLNRAGVSMKKTGSVPLAIKASDQLDQLDPTEVMGILLPKSDQWINFNLTVGDARSYVAHFPSTLPSLHTLSLKDRGSEFTIESSMPKLNYLQLETVVMCLDLSHTFGNLVQLRATNGSNDIALATLLDYLRNMPNLEVLELVFAWELVVPKAEELLRLQNHPVNLPRLTALRVDPLYSWEVVALLSCIRASSVRSLLLSITRTGVAGISDDQPLQISGLNLYFPALESLVLKEFSIPEGDVDHILTQMPAIQHLTIVHTGTLSSHPKGFLLKRILSHPPLAKMRLGLSTISVQDIPIAILHECLVNNKLELPITIRIYKEGGTYDRTRAEDQILLAEIRSQVRHVESTDEPYIWSWA